ncbi:MAG: sporulation protein YqfD [Clostridia bacterium]|nr:sporulation protein YqfD [Clostridia bacterium]
MFFTLFHYIKGFLDLKLTGLYLERFLNLCVKSGIYIWHVRKESPKEATARVSIPGFFRMREASRKTGTRVRILRKRGLPMFLHRHRRRKGFIIGFILFALILTFLSSFVWSIEIDGTEKIDKNIIRNALSSCGFREGVIKYNIKVSELKEDMLRTVPELSWIWVEIKGTRAFVHVREKTPAPPIVPLDRPCNIVAKTDGVITDFVASRGTPKIEKGTVVKKGSLLISGTVETKHGGTLLVHAEGSVKAKTWYTKTESFPLLYKTETQTGNEKNIYKVHIGNFTLPLGSVPYTSYRTEHEEKRLHLFGDVYLPIWYEKTSAYETESASVLFTPEEATSFYGEKLLKEITIPPLAEIINTEYTYILNDNETISVTCTVSCIEEIGEIREILEESKNDGEIF